MVDSHAHLDMEEFDPDRSDVLERAKKAGVGAVLCPMEVSSERSLKTGLALAAERAMIRLAAGVHPHAASSLTLEHLNRIRELAASRTVAAVGEIGLDFHYSISAPEVQRDAFRRQIALARDLGLPAIIHSRNSGEDVLELIRAERFTGGGIFHCFSEGWDIASAALDAGFDISFSGIVTFPKAAELRDIARRVPLDRILVETDAPYLAPVPHRGRRNEPAYVIETAGVIARLKNISLEDLGRATSRNFLALI